MLKAGDIAPAFQRTDHTGKTVDLDALLAAGPVVLYFYPKDMTLGCTIEACSFRDAHEELSDLTATIIGVSFDTLDSHRQFAEKNRLQFSLLADTDKALAEAFDVLGFFNLFPKRVTFVIGPERKLLGVFHHELSMKAHVKNVRTLLTQGQR